MVFGETNCKNKLMLVRIVSPGACYVVTEYGQTLRIEKVNVLSSSFPLIGIRCKLLNSLIRRSELE